MKKIVFDVDDTLWGLNEKLCKKLDIPIEKLVVFSAMDNKGLMKEERDALIAGYFSTNTFRNIKWYDGISRIKGLEALGAEIHINSNSASEKIIKLKKEQLLKVLPLPEENLHFNLVTIEESVQKKVDDDTFIFVDDSPHNILTSGAEYNLIKTQPWNTSIRGVNMMKSKNVQYFSSLNDILNEIEYILKEEKEWNN